MKKTIIKRVQALLLACLIASGPIIQTPLSVYAAENDSEESSCDESESASDNNDSGGDSGQEQNNESEVNDSQESEPVIEADSAAEVIDVVLDSENNGAEEPIQSVVETENIISEDAEVLSFSIIAEVESGNAEVISIDPQTVLSSETTVIGTSGSREDISEAAVEEAAVKSVEEAAVNYVAESVAAAEETVAEVSLAENLNKDSDTEESIENNESEAVEAAGSENTDFSASWEEIIGKYYEKTVDESGTETYTEFTGSTDNYVGTLWKMYIKSSESSWKPQLKMSEVVNVMSGYLVPTSVEGETWTYISFFTGTTYTYTNTILTSTYYQSRTLISSEWSEGDELYMKTGISTKQNTYVPTATLDGAFQTSTWLKTETDGTTYTYIVTKPSSEDLLNSSTVFLTFRTGEQGELTWVEETTNCIISNSSTLGIFGGAFRLIKESGYYSTNEYYDSSAGTYRTGYWITCFERSSNVELVGTEGSTTFVAFSYEPIVFSKKKTSTRTNSSTSESSSSETSSSSSSTQTSSTTSSSSSSTEIVSSTDIIPLTESFDQPEEGINILDEDVPLAEYAGAGGRGVQTGDESKMALFAIIVMISTMSLLIVHQIKKRNL